MNFDDKLIMYVGNKPEKRDTVTGSNLYWPGRGSVLKVDHTTAVQLVRHPDVWIEVDENGERVTRVAPAAKVLKMAVPEPATKPENDDSDDESGDGPTLEDVKAAIFGLERGNEDHFTEKGKPKLAAVNEALGYEIKMALLNQAWKEIDG